VEDTREAIACVDEEESQIKMRRIGIEEGGEVCRSDGYK